MAKQTEGDGGDRNPAQVDKALDASQRAADVEQEQGFRGDKVDPRPNEDYSLESGPDSPSALEGATTARELATEDATTGGTQSAGEASPNNGEG